MTKERLTSKVDKEPRRIRLATRPIDAANVFLYHKTTQRSIYDEALEAVSDCDDVLLWNAERYITETSVANVIVNIDGELFTPPVSCGLLGGTFRQWLLQQGEIRERAIHVDELAEIKSLTLINSVRGRIDAQICRD